MSAVASQAGNFNFKRLRHDSSSSEVSESERKIPRYGWIILESESSPPSEEDTESVYSLQAHETEYCRDTSDTDWSNYTVDAGDILMQVEYEVDSDFDKSEKFVFGDGGSSSGSEGVAQAAADLIAAAMCDSDLALWADTEDSKSGFSTDSELGHADYWTCVKCKNKNNNPLFRYCEKCYQARKNFFPPRPKGKKKKKLSSKKDGGQSALIEPSGQEASSSTENGTLVSVDLVNTEQRIVLYTPQPKTIDENTEVMDDIQSKNYMKPKNDEIDKNDNDSLGECIMCITQKKDAVFLHSGVVHICCCYKCAMRVWTESKRCPMCNRKISNVQKFHIA